MKDATPKEQILSKIRNALTEKTVNPYHDNEVLMDVIKPSDPEEEPDVLFAQELIRLGGQFIYCENEHDFLDNLAGLMQEYCWNLVWCEDPQILNLLRMAEIPHFSALSDEVPDPLVSITICEKLISTTGTIVMSDAGTTSRASFAYPDIHLVVAHSSQVTGSIKAALEDIRQKYNGDLPTQLTFISGPSRTADIEKTLVVGAHGPTQLFVFLIDDL
ncbi:hypothetical protein MASR2M12_13130 [Bacteroidales bacterium]